MKIPAASLAQVARRAAEWRTQRELILFSAALLALGAAGGIFGSTFNNYLNDTFDFSAAARSHLELPRELPGFLCALMAGTLAFLPESRLGMVAVLATALGSLGLGLYGQTYGVMLTFMVIGSAGDHLFMPVRSAVGMQLARNPQQRATMLGNLGSVETAAGILGCAFVWIAVDRWHLPYPSLLVVAGVAALFALGPLRKMRLHHGQPPQPRRWVFRREYRLYYLLCFLFGARKQVFITFAPWVLIKVFGQAPSTFARLGIVAAASNLVLKPALGRWIDRWGERRVLMADASLLILVCLGYAFARSILPPGPALTLTFLCFVFDQILFATGMARSTYLRKIALRDEEVTTTLSLGVSLDHIVSMSIPWLGGWLWERFGYPWVFTGAAILSVANVIACAFIKVPETAGEADR